MKNKNMIRNFILVVGLLLVGGFVVGSSEFSEWVRVVDLSEGDYIAVLDYETHRQESLNINYLFMYINRRFNYEIK